MSSKAISFSNELILVANEGQVFEKNLCILITCKIGGLSVEQDSRYHVGW